jgi:hypothetical protein
MTYDKEYYEKNKEKFLQWQREYRVKNRSSILENRRKYDKKNHEHQLELKYQWRKDNPIKHKESKQKSDHKQWIKNKHNPEFQRKEQLRHAKYSKENPDMMLKNNINHLKKLGLSLNMTHFKIGMALKNWSQTIRKDNPLCFCGEKADVAHHLFEKQYYPKLMLNVNNGLPLCTRHHDEVHGRKLIQRGRD